MFYSEGLIKNQESSRCDEIKKLSGVKDECCRTSIVNGMFYILIYVYMLYILIYVFIFVHQTLKNNTLTNRGTF